MIKVGYLVSYDYKYIYRSILSVYEHVDAIYLAIDVNHMTWTGNRFNIEEDFYERIKNLDTKKIIKYYRDEFYIPSLLPMENEVRERNMLLGVMGRGWLIQLDVDEYVIDFKPLRDILHKKRYLTYFPFLWPVTIFGNWITMFKKIDNSYLCIPELSPFSFITNYHSYSHPRKNKRSVYIKAKIPVLHQSWARSSSEIKQKISNWGHKEDFNVVKYFDFWNSINSNNFKDVKNFHPLTPNSWTKLVLLKDSEINNFIKEIGGDEILEIQDLNLGFIIFNRISTERKKIYKKVKYKIRILLKINMFL